MTAAQAIVTVLLLGTLVVNCCTLYMQLKILDRISANYRNVSNMQMQQSRFRPTAGPGYDDPDAGRRRPNNS
jgi:multisubunit Na+/H+ antiporter MnhC subunit